MAKSKTNADLTFEFGGKKYQVIMHAVHIPGIGERTALEITADEVAQAYLVETALAASLWKWHKKNFRNPKTSNRKKCISI
jgi:hypothetical protein